jgi:hypothetical protein
MDNLGAVGGPLLALGLVAALGVRTSILVSIVPGLLAAVAIIYAIRRTPRPTGPLASRSAFRSAPSCAVIWDGPWSRVRL